MGDNVGFFEITQPKPKGMHWKTYHRLCRELEAIERRANFTASRQYGVPIEKPDLNREISAGGR